MCFYFTVSVNILYKTMSFFVTSSILTVPGEILNVARKGNPFSLASHPFATLMPNTFMLASLLTCPFA